MSIAICDQEAFYPFRQLVQGPMTSLDCLADIEEFVRTVVLHDKISMELEPWPYDPNSERGFTEEERRVGYRYMMVAVGPILEGYDFFTSMYGVVKPLTPDIVLEPKLVRLARKFSNAGEGNAYYRSHVEFLKRIVGLEKQGGSVLLKGRYGSALTEAASKYPGKLFENLDQDWQQFAREANSGFPMFRVPPVLSIILTRCARRDAIPDTLMDLRFEWAEARSKVWELVHQIEKARTFAEVQQVRLELAGASRLMSPAPNHGDTRPIRVLWELVAGSIAGAAISQFSGGNPVVGTGAGAVGAAARQIPSLIHDLGPTIFGRGAFDLARQVRKGVLGSETDALSRLLTDTERLKLGL